MVVNHVVHLAGADAPQKPSQILGKKSNDWFQASKTREQTKYTKQENINYTTKNTHQPQNNKPQHTQKKKKKKKIYKTSLVVIINYLILFCYD